MTEAKAVKNYFIQREEAQVLLFKLLEALRRDKTLVVTVHSSGEVTVMEREPRGLGVPRD